MRIARAIAAKYENRSVFEKQWTVGENISHFLRQLNPEKISRQFRDRKISRREFNTTTAARRGVSLPKNRLSGHNDDNTHSSTKEEEAL